MTERGLIRSQSLAGGWMDKLARIFEELMPSVPAAVAFADGMQAYYDKYRAHSGRITPEYRAEACLIMTADALWVHAPRFKRVLTLALGELFGTKIVSISVNAPFNDCQILVFVDTHGRRWVVTVEEDLRVVARFPLPHTKTTSHQYASAEDFSRMDSVCLAGHDLDPTRVPAPPNVCGIQ